MKQDIISLINRRRRQIIVHSVIYYRLNDNIISDHKFDMICKELVELQHKHPEESREAVFYDEFKDFTGETGYHLAGHPWGLQKALQLMEILKKKGM